MIECWRRWFARTIVIAGCSSSPSEVLRDVFVDAAAVTIDGGDDSSATPIVDDIVDIAELLPELPAPPDITRLSEPWCADYDKDGFADPLDCVPMPPSETAPVGHIRGVPPWDCVDSDATTRPGAAELESETACMADQDDDGYGQDVPGHSDVVPGIDCDDYDDGVFLGSAEHEPTLCALDRDGDGFGDANPPSSSLWLQKGSDCDDSNGGAYPGAAEKETNDPGACKSDSDGDGYGDVRAEIPSKGWPKPPKTGHETGLDCDDTDPFAYPGAADKELGPLTCARDADLDGYGEEEPEHPKVVAGNDCDDSDAAVTTCATWCIDSDGDGLGEDECSIVHSGQTPPAGSVLVADDCDDDGWSGSGCIMWCEDADGDGLGGSNCTDVLPGKEPPQGAVPNSDDCDDTSASCFCMETYLGTFLICDVDGDGYTGYGWGVDIDAGNFDCIDSSDCTFPGAAENEFDLGCAADCDGDGFGDWQSHQGPYTSSEPGTDCDDASATTFRGAAENEPTTPGECRRDDDGDGFGDMNIGASEVVVAGTDCNDDDPTVFPLPKGDGTWSCGP